MTPRALLLASAIALAALPTAGTEKRAYPAGYWNRTAIPQKPCQNWSYRAVVKFEAPKPAEAKESVLKFLQERGAFFLPDDCRDPRIGSSSQAVAGPIVAWLAAEAIPELQTLVLRGGMLKQWQNMDASYGQPGEDALVEKWETLSEELRAHERLLKDSPMIRALTKAEIDRFSPHVDFYRRVNGKRLIEVWVE